MKDNRHLLSTVAADFRRHWKTLAPTDIAYKVVALIVLLPLAGILFRVLVAFSGKSVLSDQDILFFFLGPVGWICFVLVGGIWLGIVALEQAALMGILCAGGESRMGVIDALKFAAARARPVLKVAARLLGLVLLTLLPFLIVVGLIYATLLGSHDINFYLQQKPPEFWIALGLAGVTVAALVSLLLRLATGWLFALPLVLFADVAASDALRISRERAAGHRGRLLAWIIAWGLATIAISGLASSLVVLAGRLIVPHATDSLWLLAIAIGVVMLLGTVVNLLVNLLSTTSFATMLFHLYRELGSRGDVEPSKPLIAERAAGGAVFRLTPGRVVLGGIVGVIVAVLIGFGAIESIRTEDRATVTAHRGSSAAAPENTMAAVKQAIDDGADWVEIDVQETADGEVVVFHDSDFMKLAGKDLKIWDATMADLRDIDIGSWFDPKFSDQRVPTLGEVLDQCKGKAGVNIELKYYGHDQRLEERVAQIVEKHGMVANVVIMSLKLDAAEKMKRLRPNWKVGLLMSVSAGDISKVDVDFLAVNAAFASRAFIQSTHDMDKEVYVWTVNDAPTMSAMIGRGVDSLITDKPATARSVLKQRADLIPPQRLLLGLAGMLGVEPDLAEQ